MIDNLLERSSEFVRTKNLPECRKFIENYVEKVLVHSNKVEISFKVHVPNSDGNEFSLLKSEGDLQTIKDAHRKVG
jgi:site-specific DNA recombinase